MKRPGTVAIFLAALAGIVAAVAVHDPQWGTTFGLAANTAGYIAGFAVGVLLAAALVVLLKARMMPALASGELPVDAYHSQQRRALFVGLLVFTAVAGLALIGPMRHDGLPQTDFAIEFALIAVAGAAAMIFGNGFVYKRYRLASSDEFVRALRQRAVQLGYFLAVIGAAGVYILSLFRPDAMAAGLGLTLFAAVFGPMVYFLIAERRASGDE